MKEYAADVEKLKTLVQKTVKRSKRWKNGRWLLWLIPASWLIPVLFIPFIINDKIKEPLLIDLTFYAILYPFIAMILFMFAYAFLRGGGALILLNRRSEKVILDSTKLTNVFIQVSKKTYSGDNDDIVEIIVTYENIKNLNWNEEMFRLEITADYTYTVTNDNFPEEQFIEDQPIYIYDYFEGMGKMLDELEKYTNMKITGRGA